MTHRPKFRFAALPLALAALLTVIWAGVGPASAQADLFRPVISVNDRAITRFEIEQNRRFLTLLGEQGDIGQLAEERLIEDRLKVDAAAAAGVTLSQEQIEAGMAEFAGRANLTTEQFLSAIGQGGVTPEFFSAFVEAGLIWREVIRAKYARTVNITDAEIDRAIAARVREGGVRVRLAEIAVPNDTGAGRAAALRIAGSFVGQVVSEAAFAAEARASSVSPSAARGGDISWVSIRNLPPQLAQLLNGLRPGEVARPFPVGRSVVFFQIRGVEQTEAPAESALTIEWAELAVTDRSEAEAIRERVDTCNDLYGATQRATADSIRRETRPMREVPADVALALASLDNNEISTTFARGGQPMLLMLCRRTFVEDAADRGSIEPSASSTSDARVIDPGIGSAPSRDQIRAALVGQRLAALAAIYLEELKANATIRRQ